MSDEGAERLDRGWKRMAEITAEPGRVLVESLSDIAPDLARYVVEFGFADVYSRPGLDDRQRQLVTIAALVALGSVDAQLRVHVAGALNVGLSPEEIMSTVVHCTPYAGFPRAINAAVVAKEVIDEHAAMPAD